MNQWHIETDFVALLITLIIFFSMRGESDHGKARDQRFLFCLWVNLMNLIVDVAASVVFDLPVSAAVFHLTQTAYHALNLLIIVSWYHYTVAVVFEDNPELIRKIDIISMSFYLAYVLFVVSNLFTGSLYTFDPVHGYARGPLFFVPVGFFALYALFILGFALLRGRRVAAGRMRAALIAMPLIVAAGIGLQLSFPGWLVIFPFYTAGLLLAYVTIQQNHNDIVFRDLESAAAHDALTGLQNRAFAEKHITDFLAGAKGRDCALMMLDLDNFKHINDAFGHDAGDQALEQIGRFLSGFFRDGDIVARYGGDEFLIFVTNFGDKTKLAHRASQLILALSSQRLPPYPELSVSCSAGIARGITGETEYPLLLRQADTALYAVKRAGKNDYAFFGPEMTLSKYEHTRVDTLTLKHTDWFDSAELKRFLYALSDELPYVVSINLETGAYYGMENAAMASREMLAYGDFASLLETGRGLFHPQDAEKLSTLYTLDSLRQAAREDGRRIACEARYRDTDGSWRWARVVCLFGPEEKEEPRRAYLLERRMGENTASKDGEAQ